MGVPQQCCFVDAHLSLSLSLVLIFGLLVSLLAVGAPAVEAQSKPVGSDKARSGVTVPALGSGGGVDPEAALTVPDLVDGLAEVATPSGEQEWPLSPGDPTPVEELPERRGATSEVWRNADGTFTAMAFDEPKYFQANGSAAWSPIDLTLRPEADVVRVAAGPYTATFAPIGDGRADAGVSISVLDGRSVGFAPVGVEALVLPEIAESALGPVVRYVDVWPGVDLEYRATATGVKEDVVVREAGAASAYGFTVRGVDLAAGPVDSAGLVTADGVTGASEIRVAPPVVTDDAGVVLVEAAPEVELVGAADAPVALEAVEAAGTIDAEATAAEIDAAAVVGSDQVMTVAVDPQWLADVELPVRIDPTTVVGPTWTTAWSSLGDRCDNTCNVQAGNSVPGGDMFWRSVAKMPYESLIDNHQYVLTASLTLTRQLGSSASEQYAACAASANSYAGAVGYQPCGQGAVGSSGVIDVTDLYRGIVASDTRDVALGIFGGEGPGYYNYKRMTASLSIVYSDPPTVPVLTAPGDASVIVDATPTLTANPSTDGDGDPIAYYFRVATAPSAEGGQVINSGWLSSPTWTVPTGSLNDGQTYYWHVYASDGHAMRPAGTPWSFKVDLRLGNDPVAPMDGAAGVGVNLATGNVVVGAGTPTVSALGGDVGVTFTYNSRQARQNGLDGSYWYDDNANRVFDDGPTDLVRLDPMVSFDWGTGPVGSTAVGTDNTLVRWVGYLTVPAAGNWQIGSINDDGARVRIDNVTVLDDWVNQGAEGTASYGGLVGFDASQLTKRIEVEYYDATGGAVIRLFAKHQTDPAYPGFEVPSTWMTPDAPSLPPRWTMSAGDGDLAYVGARVGDDSITLRLADGSAVEYKKQPGAVSGWAPPKGFDDVLSLDNGWVKVQADDGRTYEFDPTGRLTKVVSAYDDRNPNAFTYGYSGTPVRLQTITDPATGRSVQLDYASDGVSPACPGAGNGFIAAPVGMLCRVKLWDNTTTQLWYLAGANGPELGRVENFAGSGMEAVTDFAYGDFGKIGKVRSPLAADVVANGVMTNDDGVKTLVDYVDSGADQYKVLSVTEPKATQGSLIRGTETYSYGAGTASVEVAGTINGTTPERIVIWDGSLRVISDQDATGATSLMAYDAEDRLVARRETHTGLRWSTKYDHAGRPVKQYGPAPASWFWNGSSYQADPFTNASITPTTTTAYDEPTVKTTTNTAITPTGVYGLAAAYYNNSSLTGAPYRHATGISATPNEGAVARDWTTFGPNGTTQDNWSVGLTGDITFGAAGVYSLYTLSAGGTRIFIDDRYLVGDLAAEAPAGTTINNGVGTFTTTTAGEKHRIRIEFADQSNNAALNLYWKPPAGVDAVVPGANLAPRYGLVTSTTEPGGKLTTTTYAGNNHGGAASGVRGEHGKPVIVTDGAGAPTALQTSFTYENADSTSTNSRMRVLTKRSPAGTITNYSYQAVNFTSSSCTAGIVQGGLPFREQSPDPNTSLATGANDPMNHDKVYDAAGRVMGTKNWASGSTDSYTCFTRDARGRVTQTVYPSFLGVSGRTAQNVYGEGPTNGVNPLVTTSTDGATATPIRVETDLLGRVVSYRDAHDRTTTFTYDALGQLTTTNIQGLPAIGRTYDATGRLDTLTYGGAVLADTTYDTTTKRMTRVDYPSGAGTAGNGTHGLFGVDQWGFSNSVDWNTGATDLTAHTYTRTDSGRVVDETIDGVDPSTGSAYTYDALKRLVTAQVKTTGATQTIDYGYAATNPASCGTGGGFLASAAKNTNRSSAEIIPTDTSPTTLPAYEYCYNKADQLVSSTDTTVGTIAYDTHGNTTQIFGETRTYDSADRHLTTTKGTTSVTYTRDVTDRIIARTSGGATQNYSFTGSGDAPSVILDGNGANVVQATLSLPGGAIVTVNVGSAARTWSYPNLHGDIAGVANEAGQKQGPTRVYDPYGNPVIGATPDNATGEMDYGWLGQHQRPIEHQTSLQPIIEMGARQYSSRVGRFLEVDPVEGGSASDYDYVSGDPVNGRDLDGTWSWLNGFIRRVLGIVRSVFPRLGVASNHSARPLVLRKKSLTDILIPELEAYRPRPHIDYRTFVGPVLPPEPRVRSAAGSIGDLPSGLISGAASCLQWGVAGIGFVPAVMAGLFAVGVSIGSAGAGAIAVGFFCAAGVGYDRIGGPPNLP